MATTYCIDTSSLISAWYERYKPNRFPKLWDQLDQLVIEGRLVSSLLVLAECEKRSPELAVWLGERASMFLPPDPVIQERVKHVTNTYSGLVMSGKEKFAADPFVIATAEVRGFTVITEEKGIETLKKIPGVCRDMGLPCINLVTLFDEEDWTF